MLWEQLAEVDAKVRVGFKEGGQAAASSEPASKAWHSTPAATPRGTYLTCIAS